MAMNIMRRITAALRIRPEDPQSRGRGDILSVTVAGVRVSPEVAFGVSVFWACVDVIASAMASSDWNVYEGARGTDKNTALPTDGLNYVLNTRFNPEMTAQSGKRAMGIAAAGYGNGYAEIEYDRAGRIIALWPISPDRVEARRDIETGRFFYRITQDYGNATVDMEPDLIFHIRGSGLLGNVGDSVTVRAATTIGEAVALQQFSAAYFGNNAQLGTVFNYKSGAVDDTKYKRLKEQLEQRHKGSRKAFTTAILDGGEWDVKNMGTTADDAQLIPAKQQIIEDMCRYFHMPPHKIQHMLRMTNNNIEHQGLEFSRDTLRPWKKEVEQEADYKLVPMRARKFIEIDLDWAEQGDYKSRAEAFAIYRAQGVFSANQILRKLGENTIGPEGDIRLVQGANIKLKDVGEAYADQPDEPTAAPDEGDDTMTAWLLSVYNRIQRRVANRTKQAGVQKAVADGREYATEALEDMRAALGSRYEQAHRWAIAVVNGGDPQAAVEQFNGSGS